MEGVRVCGQCACPTNEDEYGCPLSKCDLVLCPTCSNPEVHFDDKGNCAGWWGEGLTEKEMRETMKEAAAESAE